MSITKIAEVTLASAAASLNFTSIPGTYTDLQVVISARSAYGFPFDNLTMTFNSATSGWSDRTLEGSGSGGGGSGSRSGNPKTYLGAPPANSSTANTFLNGSVYIPNYAGSTNKSVSSDLVSEQNATEAYQDLVASLWASTAAITSINFATASGSNLVAGTTATLYGILKGSSGGVTVA